MGADLVGFAPAIVPPTPEGGPQAYQDWIKSGMHGGMGYMARAPEERSEIVRWFPPARSVVLAAFSYHDGSPPLRGDPAGGRLARYSLPPDYHKELKDRMRTLLAWYREKTSGQGKVFADTSPVLERLYARYAGIGWVGKNTMVISRDIGSFFLLAGMAVDRELNYDEPIPDHCGSCNRCLAACPTDAFPRAHVLDASKCVAYLTIEHRKGPIPENLRTGVGGWVFGCDICQDVCPWNRFSVRGRALFSQQEPAVDLEYWAQMDEGEFKRRYRGTPLYRTGHKALLRNALLAMGNSGDGRYRKILQRFLSSDDAVLSEQALWSLRKLKIAKITS